MKKLSIILITTMVALVSCTKSKESFPELGDCNDEIITVGLEDVYVKYIRNDSDGIQQVRFYYCIAETQQFDVADMTKKSGYFDVTLNNLVMDTLYKYYYEIFPYSGNTYQTEQKSFRTQINNNSEAVPTGAINGLYTVNSNGKKVYFSQGNLQYQASTNTWKFAEYQWDYVGTQIPDNNGNWGGTVIGSENAHISSTYNGWIDLFGWGTSGYNHGAVCYQPWSTSSHNDYMAYGIDTANLYDYNGKADWGYNVISNGGNMEQQWRTMTASEWEYVLLTRQTVSGIRFAKAQVNGINGMILLPDEWIASVYSLEYGDGNTQYTDNIISGDDWKYIFEANGAVFLPSSGCRWIGPYTGGVANVVSTASVTGYYWTSVSNGSWYKYQLFLTEQTIHVSPNGAGCGSSVRLVSDANK